MSTLTLPLQGGTLAYDDQGPAHAPLVVCVPGMGDRRQVFRFLTPLLVEAGFRVVTADPRGHGESTVGWPRYDRIAVGADTLDLLRHLGVPAVVVGHSAGATSALWAQAQAPELVSGVVLVGPFITPAKNEWVSNLALGIVGRSATLWAMFYRSLYPSARPADFDEYLAQLKRTLRQRGRMAAVRGYPRGNDEALSAAATSSGPAHIVIGAEDPDYPDPAAELEAGRQVLEQQGRRVGTTLVPDSGHYPHADSPRQTAAAIIPFLKEVLHASEA
ncbi:MULTISPECIES: alpha/beta hydrolase [unclassified Diaminobutyricimonas]|uniref:alpha/beta fold hydrolase n=1 Tax=unclassified Diaminobutyricimonas TaxID=2643261 RepID=UPI0012F4BA51|nr:MULTISPECIES: alpha/beta hydrolase [unclassified Diaminobutyricimonas]